jgi:hypothetical protein
MATRIFAHCVVHWKVVRKERYPHHQIQMDLNVNVTAGMFSEQFHP